MSDSYIKRGGEGTLYSLLYERFPQYHTRGDAMDLPDLGKAMNLSHESAYRMVRGKRSLGYPGGFLSVKTAVRLMEFSRTGATKPITIDELLPFVIPHLGKYQPGAPAAVTPDLDDLLS